MPESEPIKVYPRDGQWLVDYGSYAHGFHTTQEEAVKTATAAAAVMQRELVIEGRDPTAQHASFARDEVADRRDAIADRRDAIADDRDRVADRRDRLADDRDRAAEQQWPSRLTGS